MSFSGCSGKPSFPPTFVGDLRELPRVPMRGEGRCGVGGASRDSTGFVAMEEGRGGSWNMDEKLCIGAKDHLEKKESRFSSSLRIHFTRVTIRE